MPKLFQNSLMGLLTHMVKTPARRMTWNSGTMFCSCSTHRHYLLLKYAIKPADLGLLRRAIDHCCVYFHRSGQFKYAYEMLYLLRLTSTHAATPELQRA